MLADLHAHALPASRDARDPLQALAAAVEPLGIGALALTDHDPGADYGAAREILGSHGVVLVPGREVDTPLGHVVVLSTDTEWLGSLPSRTTLPLPGRSRAQAALIWAHPAGWRVAGAVITPDPSKGAEHVHAVEVLNGERLWQPGGVATAAELAQGLALGACGGSDAHDAGSAGRCMTAIDAAEDASSIVEAVRAGACRPVLGRAWAEREGIRYERQDLTRYA
ncbi:MAG: PHP-associated domain-containing protein [Actinomycetota bacterium]